MVDSVAKKNIFRGKEKNKSDTRFYVFLGIMLFILFTRNALSVNIPVFVFLILSLFPALSKDENYILAFAACCLPMSAGFQYKYALFICIVAILIRCKGRVRLSSIAYPILLMVVWELLHAFSGQFSFYEYIRSFAELFFLVVIVSCIDFDNVNHKLIYRALAISTVVICLIMLYLQLQQFGFNFDSVFGRGYNHFRFGQANTMSKNYGLNFNPNGLGVICNLSVVSILILFGRKEHSIFDLVMLVFAAIFGLMTLSRTYVISLAFIIIYFILTSTGRWRQRVLSVIGVVAITAVIIWLISKYVPHVFYDIISRFREEDLSGGRGALFSFYNQHIFSSIEYFFFGIGLQDFQEGISSIYNVSINVAHNGFQEVWVVWGIVGVALFIWMIIALIKEAKKYEPHQELRQFLPLGLMFVNITAGQLIRSETALLSLVIVLVSLCVKNQKK